MTIIWKNCHRK